MIKTIVTARDASAPKIEVVPGHFVSACLQRTWRGEATDETISSWLRANGLSSGSVHVYRVDKARHETMHNRKVVA